MGKGSSCFSNSTSRNDAGDNDCPRAVTTATRRVMEGLTIFNAYKLASIFLGSAIAGSMAAPSPVLAIDMSV